MSLLQHLYSSPRDLFEKIEREGQELVAALGKYDEQRIRDLVFNFSVGCYHLVDWVKVLYPTLEGDVYALLNGNPYLKLCRDIANASKHYEVDPNSPAYKRYPPVLADLDLSATDHDIYKIDFPQAEDIPPFRVKLHSLDGSRTSLDEFVRESIKAWKEFLSAQDI